jgi:hypothetical protein
MPCTTEEAMAVILSIQDIETGDRMFGERVEAREGEGSRPPLVECVYADNVTANGFDIVAGNRMNTYWRYRLSLSGSDPVRGNWEPVEMNDETRWPGNIFKMVFYLGRAVHSVGGTLEEWPM